MDAPAPRAAGGISPRLLAFYLPQFHPTPENNAFWGEGYTEWTNVARAEPLYPGHYQPRLPADLGFYDLRLPEARQAQAALAREHGVHGFVYYHYWFDGRRLLERPFEEVLRTGEPDFPFALCWANHRWTWKRDHSLQGRLQEQDYSEEDDRKHIRYLLEAFQDDRYIKVGGRPLFLVYWTASIPDPKRTFDLWREEASRAGVAEPYVCKVDSFGDFRAPEEFGCDASVEFWPHAVETMIQRVREPDEVYERNQIFEYRQLVASHLERPWPDHKRYPCVVPHWDNTARWKATGARMIRNSTPELYGAWLEGVVRRTAAAYDPEDQLVFVNAWNEWGEGTYLEPDVKHGRAYLEATRDALRRAGAKVDKKGTETEIPPPASPEERSRRLQAKYEDLQRRYNEQLAFEERSPLLQKSEQRYEDLLEEHHRLRHEHGLLERRCAELQRRTGRVEERLARISANQPLVDTERLTTWMRQLDEGIQALLQSSRYRAGERFGRTLDRIRRRPQTRTSADHLQDVLNEFKTWSKRPGEKKRPVAGLEESRKRNGAVATEIALVFAAIFWGLNFAATKYATDAIPPLVLVAFRFALGGALLYGILRLIEPKSRLARRDVLPMAAIGCFGVAAAQTGFTFGISLASASSTGLIFATAPVWGMLLGSILGLERPTRRGVIGVGLSVAGVAAVVSGGLGSGEGSLVGDLIVLAAAACVGAYAVLSMPLLERYSPLAVATYPLLFATPFLLVLSSPQLVGMGWGSVGAGPLLAVAYAAVFSTAFAFSAWQWGISRIGANRVLAYQYLITLVGAGSGIVFFGESLGPEKIVGGIVILLGVYLARR